MTRLLNLARFLAYEINPPRTAPGTQAASISYFSEAGADAPVCLPKVAGAR